MALFSRTPKKEEKKDVAVATALAVQKPASKADFSHALMHARITEKASMQQGGGVYTFDISASATKRDIIHAIKSLYGVTPRKVAVVTIPSKLKRNMRTGRAGVKKGGRKAYVYLKKGDTITIS